MAWGARVEDGKWRLCFRKGKTITEATVEGVTKEVFFANQKKAKACADELNEKYWDQYKLAKEGKGDFPVTCRHDMVRIMEKFMT